MCSQKHSDRSNSRKNEYKLENSTAYFSKGIWNQKKFLQDGVSHLDNFSYGSKWLNMAIVTFKLYFL